jgi:hypothetical protein
MHCSKTLITVAISLLPVVSRTTLAAIDVRVDPGQRLVLEFHQDGLPPLGTDTLTFGSGAASFFLTGNQFSLYDGNNLLGTVLQTNTDLSAAFRTPSSPWTNDSAIVDFSSILAGTLNGRLVVTPQFASPSGFVRYISRVVTTVDATGQDTFVAASQRVAVIDAAFAIPEPASARMVVIAFCSMWPRRRMAAS